MDKETFIQELHRLGFENIQVYNQNKELSQEIKTNKNPLVYSKIFKDYNATHFYLSPNKTIDGLIVPQFSFAYEDATGIIYHKPNKISWDPIPNQSLPISDMIVLYG